MGVYAWKLRSSVSNVASLFLPKRSIALIAGRKSLSSRRQCLAKSSDPLPTRRRLFLSRHHRQDRMVRLPPSSPPHMADLAEFRRRERMVVPLPALVWFMLDHNRGG
jgi:hypothetical protein